VRETLRRQYTVHNLVQMRGNYHDISSDKHCQPCQHHPLPLLWLLRRPHYPYRHASLQVLHCFVATAVRTYRPCLRLYGRSLASHARDGVVRRGGGAVPTDKRRGTNDKRRYSHDDTTTYRSTYTLVGSMTISEWGTKISLTPLMVVYSYIADNSDGSKTG